MPSTYTTNLGIEKIATGEQSGTWGTTTNTNLDLIDEAVNGVEQVTLAAAGSSGSPNDLPITNGASSDGRNKFIEFIDGGDLGGTAYVQLTPNDAEKVVHIRNSLSAARNIIIFQGTYNASNDFEIPNGADVVLKFDGAGAGAVVSDVYVNLTPTKLTTADLIATTADINGGSVDGATLGTNSAITEAQVDNININGNTISSTDTNGDITISPDGTGTVVIDTDLDVDNININGNAITSTDTNGNIALTPDGIGEVDISKVDIDGGSIDGATIGGSTPAAGSFTTITGSGDMNIDSGTLFVDVSENRVGINETSPDTVMHINGGTENNMLLLESTDDKANITFQDNATTSTNFIGCSGDDLRFGGGGAETFRTDTSTQRVMIGSSVSTVTQGRRLHVQRSGAGTNTGIEIQYNRNGTGAPEIDLIKTRGETNNSATIVASADPLGTITWYGGDGTDCLSAGASIQGAVDGATGSDDMPGKLIFSTTADGNSSPSERMRITQEGYVGIGTTSPGERLTVSGGNIGLLGTESSPLAIRSNNSGAGLIEIYGGGSLKGGTIQFRGGTNSGDLRFLTGTSGSGTEAMRIDSSQRVLIGDSSSISSPDRKLQIIGTTADNSSMSLARFSNSANSSQITFIKSRAGGNGSNAVVSDDDNLGILQFHADDGSDYDSVAARIAADSDGTSGSNDTPGRLRFMTTADGASSPTERMRIDNRGKVQLNNAVGEADASWLQVRKDSGAEYLLYLESSTGNSGNQRGLKITSDTPNLSSPLILVENSGGEIFKVQNDGTMSKASGSFKINHPLESKKDTHFLVHSFVEAPQADNIYRGKVDLVNGTATVNIDTVAGMTEGTFAALNREVQCFTSNESGWTAVRGSVSGNILTIEAQDNTCTDTISWLVVGERQDEHIRRTSMTDENGKVIVEPEKEAN